MADDEDDERCRTALQWGFAAMNKKNSEEHGTAMEFCGHEQESQRSKARNRDANEAVRASWGQRAPSAPRTRSACATPCLCGPIIARLPGTTTICTCLPCLYVSFDVLVARPIERGKVVSWRREVC
jgi:hypothetical protein